jgi:hypothetical protein
MASSFLNAAGTIGRVTIMYRAVLEKSGGKAGSAAAYLDLILADAPAPGGRAEPRQARRPHPRPAVRNP